MRMFDCCLFEGMVSVVVMAACDCVVLQQCGAVEARWAHNPEVRRSKLRSAKPCILYFYSFERSCRSEDY